MTFAPEAPASAGGDAFEVDVRRQADMDVVTARGDLDLTSAVKLRHVLFDPVLCSAPVVVVDLHDVSFLDSTGIGTLVAGRRWSHSRGARFVIVCGEGRALRVLELVRLHTVMEIHPTLDAVVAAPGGPAGAL